MRGSTGNPCAKTNDASKAADKKVEFETLTGIEWGSSFINGDMLLAMARKKQSFKVLDDMVYNELVYWGRRIRRGLRYSGAPLVLVTLHSNGATFAMLLEFMKKMAGSGIKVKDDGKNVFLKVTTRPAFNRIFAGIDEQFTERRPANCEITGDKRRSELLISKERPWTIKYNFNRQVVRMTYSYQSWSASGVPQTVTPKCKPSERPHRHENVQLQ